MSAAAVGVQVSSDSWKGASANNMKLSQAIIARSDKGLRSSRRTDPLPLLRDACIRESNDRIHAYVRATRAVIVHLRKTLVATNEEIKALTRGKESLERTLEHTRKDLALNHQSIEIRGLRPAREKEPDAADMCLLEERTHLLSIKRSLEAELSKVHQQLQVLSVARARLAAIVQERSRVTDLLCHSMSMTVAVSHFSSSSQIFGKVPPSMTLGAQGIERSQSARGSRRVQRSKANSAPVPLQLPVIREEEGTTDREPDREQDHYICAGPYDAFSLESQDSVQLATDTISKSQEIRRELRTVIGNKRLSQISAHNTVNEGLTRKLAETVTFTQHLQVNAGQVKVSMHRGQRCIDTQEKGQGYLLGPVSSSHLTTREKLDRPLVKVFQRHPGTDLPEASHFAQANTAYTESLERTRKNLMLLHLAQKGLQADIGDKKTAADIDSSIVRLRRQRANHRWVLDGSATSSRPHHKLVRGSSVTLPSSAPNVASSSGSSERRDRLASQHSTRPAHTH